MVYATDPVGHGPENNNDCKMNVLEPEVKSSDACKSQKMKIRAAQA